MSISVGTHGYLSYTSGCSPTLYLFCCSNCSTFATGSSFSWFLWSFDLPPSMCCYALFLSTSLLSGTVIFSGLILYISCLSLRIPYFSVEPWLLLLKNGIRNQDLDTRYAHCCWGVISFRPSQFTGQGNVYVHTNLCLYIYW